MTLGCSSSNGLASILNLANIRSGVPCASGLKFCMAVRFSVVEDLNRRRIVPGLVVRFHLVVLERG